MSDDISIKQFEDVNKFQNEVLDTLKIHEAENNLIIGLLDTLSHNKYQYSDEDPLLLAIYRNNSLSTISIMTPPYNIIVSRANEDELKFLASFVFQENLNVPGVLGQNSEAELFSNYYSKLIKKQFRIAMNEKLYQLKVISNQLLPYGKMRFATMDDYNFLKKWAVSFAIDAKMSQHDIEKTAERFKKKILDKSVAIWDDGKPRAMATFQGKTPNGIRIGYVYTPKEYRRNGFGGAVTSKLSQYLLENGNKFCFLFTDLSNQISNSIYKKIGYKEVCDFNMIKFID